MKQFKIEVPDGYEIDQENSNLAEGVVKFKPVATEPKSFKRWRAEHGEQYWIGAFYIDGVESEQEDGYKFDNHLYAIGDYFKTKEEAEEYRKGVLKKREILDFIREKNEGWTPVFNGVCKNYCINYNYGKLAVGWWLYRQVAPTPHYFKSREIGEELIEKFGNDLNYLFV